MQAVDGLLDAVDTHRVADYTSMRELAQVRTRLYAISRHCPLPSSDSGMSEDINAYADFTAIGRCRGYTGLLGRRGARLETLETVTLMMAEVSHSSFEG